MLLLKSFFTKILNNIIFRKNMYWKICRRIWRTNWLLNGECKLKANEEVTPIVDAPRKIFFSLHNDLKSELNRMGARCYCANKWAHGIVKLHCPSNEAKWKHPCVFRLKKPQQFHNAFFIAYYWWTQVEINKSFQQFWC